MFFFIYVCLSIRSLTTEIFRFSLLGFIPTSPEVVFSYFGGFRTKDYQGMGKGVLNLPHNLLNPYVPPPPPHTKSLDVLG